MKVSALCSADRFPFEDIITKAHLFYVSCRCCGLAVSVPGFLNIDHSLEIGHRFAGDLAVRVAEGAKEPEDCPPLDDASRQRLSSYLGLFRFDF